ncbi:MAG TPA: hypothetical protein VFM94_12295 [Solirubrobacterales bacterium]|nr:hypothetical protein [Solirubrobacterales bacterium]
MLFTIVVTVIPAIAFVATWFLVGGKASERYFELVAQIIPILLLTLAVEQRYFARRRRFPFPPTLPEPSPPEENWRKLLRVYSFLAHAYALLLLAILALGEFTALQVVAGGESTHQDLRTTAGSLAAGFTALVLSTFSGSGRSPDDAR